MKITDLPKTSTSSSQDLITITQGEETKTITKQSLLNELTSRITLLTTNVNGLSKKVSNNISKDTPFFNNAVTAPDPTASTHLSTKNYVDGVLFNTVKNDGTVKLSQNLSYSNHPNSFLDEDVVDKKYVDDELKNTLKTFLKYSGEDGYPFASSGDCFLIENTFSTFATNGPEVQEGDILVCIENSEGGTHGEVGHQFAIVNTNIVFATEELAGILKVAKNEDLLNLDTNESALTPFTYKKVLETSSQYNRNILEFPTNILTEDQKGIIGVDCRRNSVSITLPTISRLTHPTITKFTIKDEYGTAAKNNITLIANGGNSIQGSRTHKITDNFSSITLYSDSENKWYIENSFTSSAETSSKIQNFLTDSTTGENATITSSYESVMSLDVNLQEYPVGTAFEAVIFYSTAGNTQDKKIALGINGSQISITESSLLDANPNLKFGSTRVTLLNIGSENTIVTSDLRLGTLTDFRLSNSLTYNWNSTISVSADVLCATAATDIDVFGLQIIPLK